MPRYTIVGPPGTGKTEFLRRQVEVFADRDGIPPEEMVVCSLTRTAASVLRGRLPIPEQNAQTLHSLAYRALGMPELAVKGKLAKEWNALPGQPDSWHIEERTPDGESPVENAGSMLNLYSKLRALDRPSPSLEKIVAPFAAKFEDFKKQTDSIDFTDMLWMALESRLPIPQQARVFCCDEFQDLTPLAIKLAELWGEQAKHFLCAGDPAQTIFEFLGAEPGALLHSDPATTKVLGQSYRLPQTVQVLAERWLSHHSPPMMNGRIYKPTQDGGIVEWVKLGPDDGEAIAERAAADAAVGTTLVLASCSYQLHGVVRALKAAGIPFQNHLRPRDASWNPLGVSDHGHNAATRIRALLSLAGDGGYAPGDGEPCERCGSRENWTRADGFIVCTRCDGGPPLAGQWDQSQIKIWTELFKNDAFLDGGAGRGELLQREHLTLAEATAHLAPVLVEAVAQGNLDELAPLLYARWTRQLPYLAAVCRREGRLGLYAEPALEIGTVHSYKGGESDHVLYLPHLSPAAERGRAGNPDGAIRARYVGMTRARETLTLCVGKPKSWGSAAVERDFLALEV